MRASRLGLPGLVWVLAAAFGVSACGHHGGSMTPTPTATSIAVHSIGPTVFLGANETFTATMTFSDGSTAAVTAGTWSTDAPTIATVDATGKVTGRASGLVTVIVDASGVRGTKAIRVLPTYAGGWNGRYGLNNCSGLGPGTLVQTCEDLDDFGSGFRPASFTFTQTGDAVTGTTVLGFLTSTMTGTVAADGSLTFTATAIVGTKHYAETWHLTSTTDGALSGSVTVVGSDTANPTTVLNFDCNVFNVARS